MTDNGALCEMRELNMTARRIEKLLEKIVDKCQCPFHQSTAAKEPEPKEVPVRLCEAAEPGPGCGGRQPEAANEEAETGG